MSEKGIGDVMIAEPNLHLRLAELRQVLTHRARTYVGDGIAARLTQQLDEARHLMIGVTDGEQAPAGRSGTHLHFSLPKDHNGEHRTTLFRGVPTWRWCSLTGHAWAG